MDLLAPSSDDDDDEEDAFELPFAKKESKEEEEEDFEYMDLPPNQEQLDEFEEFIASPLPSDGNSDDEASRLQDFVDSIASKGVASPTKKEVGDLVSRIRKRKASRSPQDDVKPPVQRRRMAEEEAALPASPISPDDRLLEDTLPLILEPISIFDVISNLAEYDDGDGVDKLIQERLIISTVEAEKVRAEELTELEEAYLASEDLNPYYVQDVRKEMARKYQWYHLLIDGATRDTDAPLPVNVTEAEKYIVATSMPDIGRALTRDMKFLAKQKRDAPGVQERIEVARSKEIRTWSRRRLTDILATKEQSRFPIRTRVTTILRLMEEAAENEDLIATASRRGALLFRRSAIDVHLLREEELNNRYKTTKVDDPSGAIRTELQRLFKEAPDTRSAKQIISNWATQWNITALWLAVVPTDSMKADPYYKSLRTTMRWLHSTSDLDDEDEYEATPLVPELRQFVGVDGKKVLEGTKSIDAYFRRLASATGFRVPLWAQNKAEEFLEEIEPAWREAVFTELMETTTVLTVRPKDLTKDLMEAIFGDLDAASIDAIEAEVDRRDRIVERLRDLASLPETHPNQLATEAKRLLDEDDDSVVNQFLARYDIRAKRRRATVTTRVTSKQKTALQRLKEARMKREARKRTESVESAEQRRRQISDTLRNRVQRNMENDDFTSLAEFSDVIGVEIPVEWFEGTTEALLSDREVRAIDAAMQTWIKRSAQLQEVPAEYIRKLIRESASEGTSKSEEIEALKTKAFDEGLTDREKRRLDQLTAAPAETREERRERLQRQREEEEEEERLVKKLEKEQERERLARQMEKKRREREKQRRQQEKEKEDLEDEDDRLSLLDPTFEVLPVDEALEEEEEEESDDDAPLFDAAAAERIRERRQREIEFDETQDLWRTNRSWVLRKRNDNSFPSLTNMAEVLDANITTEWVIPTKPHLGVMPIDVTTLREQTAVRKAIKDYEKRLRLRNESRRIFESVVGMESKQEAGQAHARIVAQLPPAPAPVVGRNFKRSYLTTMLPSQ